MDAGRARSEAAAHSGDEVIGRDGLSQHARNVDVVERQPGSGDNDNRDVASVIVRGDFLLDRESVQRRQHQIENHDIGRALIENVQRGETVVGFHDVEPREPEGGAVHPSYRGIVFYYKHRFIGYKHRFIGAHDLIITGKELMPP
jgi:hypothetical protein